MNNQRRSFLRKSMASSLVAVSVASGLLTPSHVLAAWPKAAFDSNSVKDAMMGLLGTEAFEETNQIQLRTPDIAENGSVVPVTVKTKITGVESISIFALENARPLAISADMSAKARPVLATRIKLGKTSKVVAVVRANGKLFGATKTIKVTLGGCGG